MNKINWKKMLVWNLLDQADPAQGHILLELQPEMLIRCAREGRQHIRLCIHPSDDNFYNNNNNSENDNNPNKNFVEKLYLLVQPCWKVILICTTLLTSSTYSYNLCAWADRSCDIKWSIGKTNMHTTNKQTTTRQQIFLFHHNLTTCKK